MSSERNEVIEECARVADNLANTLADLPPHREPTLSAMEAWERAEDACRDIADAIRSLKEPQ